MLASKCFIYADGVSARGYGHLYRMKALYDRFFSVGNATFLSHTRMQSAFFRDHGLPSIQAHNVSQHEPKLIIIDSKAPLPPQVSALMRAAKRVLVVDSLASWVMPHHLVVFPIFYFDPESLGRKNSDTNVIGGEDFVLVRSPETANCSRKILVTFGGSDPNDLTDVVLSELSRHNLLHDTTALIGPGFKKNKPYLSKYPDVHFAFAPPTTSEFVKSAELVITALGTTLQEVEFYEKRCCLLLNYQADIGDVELIKKFSKNPSRFMNCGFYQCTDFGVMNKAIESLSTAEQEDVLRVTKDWGTGWPPLLAKLGIER